MKYNADPIIVKANTAYQNTTRFHNNNNVLVSHFTWMHCGDLNNADKDYSSELKFNLLKGSLD